MFGPDCADKRGQAGRYRNPAGALRHAGQPVHGGLYRRPHGYFRKNPRGNLRGSPGLRYAGAPEGASSIMLCAPLRLKMNGGGGQLAIQGRVLGHTYIGDYSRSRFKPPRSPSGTDPFLYQAAGGLGGSVVSALGEGVSFISFVPPAQRRIIACSCSMRCTFGKLALGAGVAPFSFILGSASA